ncbi:uncharacterized protein EKO05_0006175 [Ascochyta rabiei]|uniref:Uncharacterized protein n=1 Tax=Didymella rabiei TaxID=5454 RepID=A0A163AVY7_DIDRA|nr:uncharacterized protein EKO05_0006175 [Ascochyta rabiei]KZM21424.1 hypothetical protein ST47_g7445 [Ascochyta rabiei]UPX15735.1 hypothetical protein EKO05_0006175 [Ascochyta rabiei]
MPNFSPTSKRRWNRADAADLSLGTSIRTKLRDRPSWQTLPFASMSALMCRELVMLFDGVKPVSPDRIERQKPPQTANDPRKPVAGSGAFMVDLLTKIPESPGAPCSMRLWSRVLLPYHPSSESAPPTAARYDTAAKRRTANLARIKTI